MKFRISTAFIIASALGLILAGCAQPGLITATTAPVVSQSTTPVVTESTNTVVTQNITNNVTTFQTNVVITVQTNLVTIFSTNSVTTYSTNYVANSALVTAGTTISAAAPIVPAPWGAIIRAAGTLLFGLATGTAVYKNAKVNQHESTIQSIVAGVENSLPAITQAISTATPAAAGNQNATQALSVATAALSAVKASISSATTASGTNTNLNNIAATVGAGPQAA